MASSSHQSGSKFATEGMSEEEVTAAIEVSRVQGWSELKDGGREGSTLSCHSDADAATWEELKRSHPRVFVDFYEGSLQLGAVIAEGGQATIYQAKFKRDVKWYMLGKVPKFDMVAKVFKMEGFSLADLQRQWPQATKTPAKLVNSLKLRTFQMGGVVFGEFISGFCRSIYFGTILDDGRFAFVIPRCWGDLRSLINDRLNVEKSQRPPFLLVSTIYIMFSIGKGMEELHARGVLHRDLKAANILVKGKDPLKDGIFMCQVADYESSMMVQGTGFWRAPEVLEDLQKQPSERDASIWTEKVDIYSYAMTCYEVLTGLVPFDGCTKSHWKKVIDGERPLFPDYVDPRLQSLVERCWHKDPLERPTFENIVYELEAIENDDLEVLKAALASLSFFTKLRMGYEVKRHFKRSGDEKLRVIEAEAIPESRKQFR